MRVRDEEVIVLFRRHQLSASVQGGQRGICRRLSKLTRCVVKYGGPGLDVEISPMSRKRLGVLISAVCVYKRRERVSCGCELLVRGRVGDECMGWTCF